MALQIPHERLKFFHLMAPGAVNIKGCLQDIDMGDCEKVFKVLQDNDKGYSINPTQTLIIYQNINVVQPAQTAQKDTSTEIQKGILDSLTGNFLLNENIWYYYEQPIWRSCSDEFVKDSLRNLYMELKNEKYIPFRLLENLYKDLEANCLYGVDFDNTHLVGFNNGFLNLTTLQFETPQEGSESEFFKRLYLKDYLPYNLDMLDPKGPSISSMDVFEQHIQDSMPTIYNWFMETLGDFNLVSIILCFAAAIIKQLSLDRFLFFWGPANTGKSTAIRFFDKLFIKDSMINKQITDLSSQYGLSELPERAARCIAIRDAEGNKISLKAAATIKNLVSNREPVSISRKYLTAVNYVFKGGLIIASNFSSIFQTTAKGILEKRLIPLEFPNVIPPEKQKDLKDLFPDKEISCFISIILKLDNSFILKTLRLSHKLETVQEMRDTQIESSTLATVLEFVNKYIVYSPGGFIPGGATLRLRAKLHSQSLYGKYLEFFEEEYPKRTCENFSNFRDKLDSVLQNLGWFNKTPPVKVQPKGKVQVKQNGEIIQDRQRGLDNIAWASKNDDLLDEGSPYSNFF